MVYYINIYFEEIHLSLVRFFSQSIVVMPTVMKAQFPSSLIGGYLPTLGHYHPIANKIELSKG